MKWSITYDCRSGPDKKYKILERPFRIQKRHLVKVIDKFLKLYTSLISDVDVLVWRKDVIYPV